MRETAIRLLAAIEAHRGASVLVLALLVFAAGSIYSGLLGDTLRYADEGEYLLIAENLVRTGTYTLDAIHPTAKRPPGYPLFLSLTRFLGGDIFLGRVLNFFLLSGCMLLLYGLLRQSAYAFAGVVAVFLVLCYPVLFYAAGTFFPQTLGSFLFLAFLWLLFRPESISPSTALAAGCIAGGLILTIPTFVFVVALTLVFFVFQRRSWKTILAVSLGGCIIVGMWMARNYAWFGEPIPFSTNSGLNLLAGNSPKTTPNSGITVDLSSYTLPASVTTETQEDAFYRSEAIRFVTENPKRAIVLYIQKLLNYFNYRNHLASSEEASATREWLMFFTYYPLLALLLIRLALSTRYPLSGLERYFVITYLLNAPFQAIFFTRIRFRLPFDFLLIGVAAIVVAMWLDHLRRPEARAT